MNAVSYRGTAPALTDIIGGHVPAMFIPLPEALPHASIGAVRMLALSDDRRARRRRRTCRPSPSRASRVSAA